MTDGTWAEGVARFEAVQRNRFARGGLVSGPGGGFPIRFDPGREQIVTAKQASAARDVLQAINDATPTAAEWVADRQRDAVYELNKDWLEREAERLGVTVGSILDLDGTEYLTLAQPPPTATPLNHCHQCGRPIRVMINRGTGWCSENCRKALVASILNVKIT